MKLDWLIDLNPKSKEFDPQSREILTRLLNEIENIYKENQELKAENQRLRDEIAQLKGHKGKPKIKANRQTKSRSGKEKTPNQESSSNSNPKPSRQQRIKIDREQVVKLERAHLPKDVVHRGYREVTIQNILFKTDTVLYRLERLYSANTGKLYEAQLPVELSGQSYGKELEAFVIMLYYELRVPQEKIVKLLQSQGLVISAGKIARLLTQQYLEKFKTERNQVLKAGLVSTSYQHIDDTGMRVNGENRYAVTLCNPYYSSFFTTQRKNAQTVSQLLEMLSEEPNSDLGLREYIKILVADDAGQFHNQTQHRGLCWIHEARHYEKLSPVIPIHQTLLEEFLKDFWVYYYQLKDYQQSNPEQRQQQKLSLSEEFDGLFSQVTGYDELDHRLSLTRQKKPYLLLVLEFPEVPLDNNEAERALREYVVKRKISNGTRTETGTQAWEIFLALVDTCRKLGVNFYQYILDRISQTCEMPALATLIFQKSQPCLS
jgi:hypothetical protein